MIRKITRPSTARCTLPMYISFLLGEPQYGSCSRLADVMNISHDSANRFLQRERYEGKDLYNESAPLLILKGGTLSVDDSVLDKPYSQYLAFVSYFWSGKHKRSVKGINLITLYYTDTNRHWHIEQHHRAIKQVCNIENFQVRSKTAIRNHLFAALCGYVQLQKLSAMSLILNCYSIQRNLFNGVIAGFIANMMPTMNHLNSEFQVAINA